MVDRKIVLRDADSIAAAGVLSKRFSRRRAGSTGAKVCAWAQLSADLAREGNTGSVVSVQSDQGKRYTSKYFSDAWIATEEFDPPPGLRTMRQFFVGCGFAAP